MRRLALLLVLSACASGPRRSPPRAFTAGLPDDPILPVSPPAPIERLKTASCPVDATMEPLLAWWNQPSWTGGERSSFEVHGDCVLGSREDGEYHAKIDLAEVIELAQLVPPGSVSSRARDAAMTTLRIDAFGREDVLRFPVSGSGVMTAEDPGQSPAFRTLEARLRAVEERVWTAPWRVVRARVIAPAEIVRDAPTKVRVAIANPGEQALRIQRGRNVFIAWTRPEPCQGRCSGTRISAAGVPARDIDLAAGTEREVELTAYFRTPGAWALYATVDGIDRVDDPVWFAGSARSEPVTLVVP